MKKVEVIFLLRNRGDLNGEIMNESIAYAESPNKKLFGIGNLSFQSVFDKVLFL